MTQTVPKNATLKELKACQFSSWYPKFRNLNKNPDSSASEQYTYALNNITIRSIIISPLPPEFIHFLKSDGVILPQGAESVSSFLPTQIKDEWSSDSDDNDEIPSKKEPTDSQYHFPALNEQILNALNILGPCIPKLNWSAPRDVTWMNAATLKCETVGDVYLLLKSSDFCMFDLEHALDDIDQTEVSEEEEEILEYELVLRKWSNLHKSMEFRCFVSNHQFIAISQRNHSEHYPHLKKEYMKIRSLLIDFYDEFIHGNFADGLIQNYVFDVYVDKNERVWLIDFNLWSTRTDALLFTWDDLMQLQSDEYIEDLEQNTEEVNTSDIIEMANTKPEIRVVMSEREVHYDPLANYRAPIDTVDLASENGSKAFQEFMAMCSKPSEIDKED
jgi:hypothetical protein